MSYFWEQEVNFANLMSLLLTTAERKKYFLFQCKSSPSQFTIICLIPEEKFVLNILFIYV